MSTSFRKIPWIAAGAALVLFGALAAELDDQRTRLGLSDEEKLVRTEMLPNVPGKRITVTVVSYAPGQKSGSHHHPGSVVADVLSGSIRSENSATGPVKVRAARTLGVPSIHVRHEEKEMRKFSKDPTPSQGSRRQYRVTQQNGTETPGTGQYLDNKQPGIYVDIVSGEPLFASINKFDSGSRWPSFTKPLEPENVVKNTDSSHGMTRTEVRSRRGDSHLSHVFPDGPRKAGGLRYCINPASPRFIPLDNLERESYVSLPQTVRDSRKE
jgi:peptide-methionine (R)-S-oxide reductase